MSDEETFAKCAVVDCPNKPTMILTLTLVPFGAPLCHSCARLFVEKGIAFPEERLTPDHRVRPDQAPEDTTPRGADDAG